MPAAWTTADEPGGRPEECRPAPDIIHPDPCENRSGVHNATLLVRTLEPPYNHHLAAAIGWVELGNPAEARAELNRLPPSLQHHPDVLDARWQVAAAEKNWDQALTCAEELWRQSPDRSSAWLHRAYALRRVPGGGLEQAWAALRPAYDKFPGVPLVAYNLSCYAAQLGRVEEAWDWLQKAIEAAGDLQGIKAMALNDPDLAPLWDRLRPL